MRSVRGVQQLVVCARPRWVAEDLAGGLPADVAVWQEYGLGVPEVDLVKPTAWWTPAAFAARMARAGVDLDLSAPGPSWIAGLPACFTKRHVWVGRLRDVGGAPKHGFAKPAEAKVAGLEAGWWEDISDFVAAASSARVPEDGWVQITETRLTLAEEHRCFVLDGVVLTTSPYLDRNGHTYELGMETSASFAHKKARRFAQEAVDSLGPRGCPDAFVVDVGLDETRGWVVIEANPAWCSGAYGCDMVAVAETVIASSLTVPCRSSTRHGEWFYRPDAALTAQAERMVPLRPAVCHRVQAKRDEGS